MYIYHRTFAFHWIEHCIYRVLMLKLYRWSLCFNFFLNVFCFQGIFVIVVWYHLPLSIITIFSGWRYSNIDLIFHFLFWYFFTTFFFVIGGWRIRSDLRWLQVDFKVGKMRFSFFWSCIFKVRRQFLYPCLIHFIYLTLFFRFFVNSFLFTFRYSYWRRFTVETAVRLCFITPCHWT